MFKYVIQFWGRKVGSLGFGDWYQHTCYAESKNTAVLKLYDYYEHIHHGTIRVVSIKEFEPVQT